MCSIGLRCREIAFQEISDQREAATARVARIPAPSLAAPQTISTDAALVVPQSASATQTPGVEVVASAVSVSAAASSSRLPDPLELDSVAAAAAGQLAGGVTAAPYASA